MAKKAFLKDYNDIEILPITRGELVLDSSGKIALHSNEFLATESQPGLMSKEDKQKLESVVVDTELNINSNNPVQNKVLTQIINNIRNEYLKSVVVKDNKLTITDQENNTVDFINSTYGVVSQTLDGLVPKLGTTASNTIVTQADEWVLASTQGGSPTWRKLPINAFKNDNTTYTFTSSNGGFTVTPSGGSDQFVGIGYIDGKYINKLTEYTKATTISALAATDTLNTALGKLEYKTDVAYDLVKGAYDGDGTIENLVEVLKVLEDISDTETIKNIIGKYLPLIGGTLTGGLTITQGNLSVSSGNVYAEHFYENSDVNLKNNIKKILDSNNIPVIKEFDWKSDGTHSYGLIAQELEEQGYSELVSYNGFHKTVNYSAALSLIVGKLQNKIKELEAEIENLKLRA